MTPTEQAARWLADVPRRYDFDPQYDYLREDHALAAIARHLSPEDDLVATITDAADDWQECLGHVVTALGGKPDWHGAELQKIAELREAIARIAALTATVGELQAEVDRKIDPAQVDALVAVAEPMLNDALSAAEREAATLRDRLARMEGANATSLNAAEALADKYRDALQLVTQLGNATAQRIARAALTDGGTA